MSEKGTIPASGHGSLTVDQIRQLSRPDNWTPACWRRDHDSCTHVINLGPGVRGIRTCKCWCHGPKHTDDEWVRKAAQLLTGQEP